MSYQNIDRSRRRLSLSLLLAATCGGMPARGIAAEAVFRIAYHEDFAPFSQRRDGRMAGIFVNIMDELLVKRLGLAVEHEGYPWARAQQRVREGHADAFVTVATEERRAYTVPTQEWITQGRLAMFVRTDEPQRARLAQIRNIAELRGFNIGTYLGNNWVKSKFVDIEVNYVVNRESALKMLQAGRLQIVVDAANPTHAALRAAGMADEIVELPPALDISETHLCIGKQSPLLAHIRDIDVQLRSMKADGSLRRLSGAA
jgi:polar amino acid transport system substrate-binding protein